MELAGTAAVEWAVHTALTSVVLMRCMLSLTAARTRSSCVPRREGREGRGAGVSATPAAASSLCNCARHVGDCTTSLASSSQTPPPVTPCGLPGRRPPPRVPQQPARGSAFEGGAALLLLSLDAAAACACAGGACALLATLGAAQWRCWALLRRCATAVRWPPRPSLAAGCCCHQPGWLTAAAAAACAPPHQPLEAP